MENFIYTVKCRGCEKKEEMYYSNGRIYSSHDFLMWVKGCANIPVTKTCECSSDNIMFHDIIGYKEPIIK